MNKDIELEQFNPNVILELPKADKFYDDLCFVTEDIPLQVLYSAYMQGIFPWFNELEGDPVLWQSPDPRFVIPIDEIHVSKSIRKFIKKSPYTYTMDVCFEEVMKQCGLMEREGQSGTWIGPKMLAAYAKFHKTGFVHSIEAWNDGKLVGGLYGILLGSVFCGESMFTIEPDSSKSAFVLFAEAFKNCGGKLIDCQAYTDNMARYGAIEIPRDDFLAMEKQYIPQPLEKDLKLEFQKVIEKSIIRN